MLPWLYELIKSGSLRNVLIEMTLQGLTQILLISFSKERKKFHFNKFNIAMLLMIEYEPLLSIIHNFLNYNHLTG